LADAEPVLGRGLAPGLISRLVAPVPFDKLSSFPPEKVEPLDRGGKGKRLPFGDDGAEVPSSPEENRWIALGRRRGGVATPDTGKRLGEMGGGGGKKDVCGAEDAKETVDARPRVLAGLAVEGIEPALSLMVGVVVEWA
jgi:hypothetical protein